MGYSFGMWSLYFNTEFRWIIRSGCGHCTLTLNLGGLFVRNVTTVSVFLLFRINSFLSPSLATIYNYFCRLYSSLVISTVLYAHCRLFTFKPPTRNPGLFFFFISVIIFSLYSKNKSGQRMAL